MALSMDEQRMLAEIERRLAAEDPGLAAKLSSFKRPGPATRFRSPRAKIAGSLFAVAVVAVISMMVYAMIPFRAHNPKSITSPQASGQASVAAPAKVGPAVGTSASASSAAAGIVSGTPGASHAGPASAKSAGTTGPGRAAAVGKTAKTSVRATAPAARTP